MQHRTARILRSSLVAIGLFTLAHSVTTAQSVGVAPSHWWLDDARYPDMNGLSAAFESDAVAVELAYLTGSDDRVGIPCSGLIDPSGPCVTQPMENRLRAVRGVVGYQLRAHQGRWSASLVPGAGIAVLEIEQEGEETGVGLLGASGALELGADVRLHFDVRSPAVTLFAGFGLRRFITPGESRCADCYEPFRGGFTSRRLLAGLLYNFE